jgi:hypothetical protein
MARLLWNLIYTRGDLRYGGGFAFGASYGDPSHE